MKLQLKYFIYHQHRYQLKIRPVHQQPEQSQQQEWSARMGQISIYYLYRL